MEYRNFWFISISRLFLYTHLDDILKDLNNFLILLDVDLAFCKCRDTYERIYTKLKLNLRVSITFKVSEWSRDFD